MGIATGRIPLAGPIGDANENNGEAKQRKSDVKRQERRAAFGMRHIMTDKLSLRWNAKRVKIKPGDTAIVFGPTVPSHGGKTDIGKRVA